MKKTGIVGYGLSILLGAIVMGFLFFAVVTAIQEDKNNYKYNETTTYIVRSGDTLWTIAKNYCDNRHDIREVIYEIEQLSDTSASIFPGDKLTIPLYEVMKGD